MCRWRLVLLSIGVLLSGCSERNRLGPEGPPPGEPIAQETIGPAGGGIVTDSFHLTVPPGAFDTAHTLKLYLEPDASPYEDLDVSALYRIDGLPPETPDSIRIAIRTSDGNATGAMFAIGEDAYTISAGGAAVGWWMLAAADSAGWCVGRLPACPADDAPGPAFSRAAGIRQNPRPIRVAAVRGPVSITSPGGRFRITYPPALITRENAESLGVYLDRSFGICTSMGFDARARTVWPIQATVLRQPISNYGGASYPTTGDNFIFLEFNSRHLNDPDEVRTTVVHEVFHIFQYLYDPRTAAQIVHDDAPYFWVDEATSTWIEVKMAPDTAWTSVARGGNELSPLSGLQAGAAVDPGFHGYGLSSLIKYLVRKQGEDFILAVYEEYQRSGRHPVPVLEDQLDIPYATFWHEYLGDLLQGGPYHDVTAAIAHQGTTPVLELGPVGTSDDVAVNLPDLSGRLIALSPLLSEYPDDAVVKLKCSPPCGMTAFTAPGDLSGFLTLRGESRDSLVVTGLQEILVAGRRLLVLVDNSRTTPSTYDMSIPVTVTAEVTQVPDLSTVTGAIVDLTYEATWEDNQVIPRQGLFFSTQSGTMNGGQFHASWDSTATDGMRFVGSVDILVRPEDLSLISWSAESWWYWPTAGTYNLYRASGTSAPLVYQSNTSIKYWRLGEDACEGISNIFVEQVSEGVTRRRLLHFDCNDQSSAVITLLKDTRGEGIASR